MPAPQATPAEADALRAAVRGKYAAVSTCATGHFPYPVGRASAEQLGYRDAWLAALPAELVDLFVGVGNPFRVREPRPGERVLDAGCGAGFDTFTASLMTGPMGMAVGLDLTEDMLTPARRAAGDWTRGPVSFVCGSVEDLPFPAHSFDQVISNGVLNLVPEKDRAYAELCRVLRPGGTLAVADLLVVETIPDEVLTDKHAWST